MMSDWVLGQLCHQSETYRIRGDDFTDVTRVEPDRIAYTPYAARLSSSLIMRLNSELSALSTSVE
jgi:hypothetical protein